MAADRVLEGVFAINKPAGQTSARLVAEVQSYLNRSRLFGPLLAREAGKRALEAPAQQRRRRLIKRASQVKIGHGGTLDPMATGVLILGVGAGTKALARFLGCSKSYETVVLFGASTDTYDTTGRVLREDRDGDGGGAARTVTQERVREKLAAFRGRFKQIPPLYSALHMDGKRLYEYAREGKALPREIEKREVQVTELEMTEWMEPGTHDYRFGEQADIKEKELARNVEALLDSQVEGPRPSEDFKENGLKRKADASSEPQGQGPRTKMARTNEQVEEREQEKPGTDGAAEPPVLDVPTAQEPAALRDPALSPDDAPTSSPSHPLNVNVHPATNSDPVSTIATVDTNPSTSSSSSSASLPAARLTMTVTSGFYVRSLCHDLGHALGSFGAMASLVRTGQGRFALGRNVLEMEDLRHQRGEEHWGPLLQGMLEDWKVRGDAETRKEEGKEDRGGPEELSIDAMDKEQRRGSKSTSTSRSGKGS